MLAHPSIVLCESIWIYILLRQLLEHKLCPHILRVIAEPVFKVLEGDANPMFRIANAITLNIAWSQPEGMVFASMMIHSGIAKLLIADKGVRSNRTLHLQSCRCPTIWKPNLWVCHP